MNFYKFEVGSSDFKKINSIVEIQKFLYIISHSRHAMVYDFGDNGGVIFGNLIHGLLEQLRDERAVV